jgi:PAS domain S-box-containing protein
MNKNILNKLKNPATFFILAVITSGVVTSLVGFHAYKVMEDVLKNSEQAQVISKGVEKIFLYDEVLTNSALMAASTGNPRWEIRYRSIEPKLDSIINKMLEINTLDSIEHTLKQTNTANLLLVEMENRVFDLVNQAKQNEAYQIVAGSEYNKQKIIYSEGLSKFVLSLEKALDNEQNRLKDEVRRSKWFFSLLILTLTIFWFLFGRYISRNRLQIIKLNQELKHAIIELEKSEVEILKANERYQLIAKATNDCVYDWNLTTNQIGWNEGLARLFGYPPEIRETELHFWEDKIHPDDMEALMQSVQNVFDKKLENWSGEYRFKRADGSYAIVFDRGSVQYDKDKNPLRWIGSVMDITERKINESKIGELKTNLELILNAAGEGIYGLDNNGIATFVNKSFEDIFGWKAEEVIGKQMHQIIHYNKPDGSPYPVEQCPSHLSINEGKAFKSDNEYFLRKDGSGFFAEYTSSPLIKDNKIIGAVVVFDDITQRKKAEEKINMLAHAVKSSGDCISITDINNTILFINDAFVATYGFTPEELIGKPIEMVRAGNNGNNKHILPSTLKGHWQGEVLNKRKNGSEFPIFLSTSQVLDEKGDIIFLVGIARDISKQKEYEQELQLAKEAAEGANRAKSEFLSNISHELRTPLNGIIGMTDIVAGTELTKNQERFVNNIKNSGESLLAIINDLLDFSKIESGKLELAEVEFSLRDELASILKPQGLRAFSKGLELLYNINGAIPETVIGDSQRLEQIITNLIGNAIKFTEHGSVILSAKEESRDEEKISLHFTVADTGIGIPKEKQKLIFKSFTQADNSVQRQFGGTGLGLAISASLVDLFGGRIWVESEPGNLSAGKAGGAAFHFVVPFKLAENTAPILYKADALDGVPVLVVDDNPLTAKLLKEIVAGWGMKPKIVLNGEDALVELRTKFANNNPYKILFLDIRLPGMDGFAVAETLKNDSGLKNLPIIIISMSHSPSDYDRANQLGVEAFLTKPFSHSELFNTVQEVLFKKGGTVDKLFNAAEVPAKHSQAVDEFGVRPLKILAADDNDLNHEILFEYLTGRNHSITIAKNGEEAVNYNTGNNYDLILMDLHMPVMDGFTATRAIRAKEEETNKHVIIIALTASAMKNEIEKCHAAGMDGHLSKPIRPKELFRVIHSFFSADPVPVKANNPEMDLNINMQYALEQLNGDSKMLIRLANIFMDKSPVIFNEFENTLATADRATIRSAAHKFKGSLPVFTPPYFMEYFLKYEQEIREKDLTLAKEKLKFVKKSYLALLRQTKEMVEEVMSRE